MTEHKKPTWYAPLFDSLYALYASHPDSYHVPGHKYGKSLASVPGLPDHALHSFRTVMEMDVTELSMTDDLHAPSGIIEEAQHLAAATFGAERTFFLVGGSTAGNLAMILAACEPDDLILVQRNTHKSVLNGLKLSGARAVFLMPERDSDYGLDAVPSLAVVERALQQYPEAKALFLTNPSYYGLSVNLAPYADLVHRYGKMLLVDEAHGAHYGLHSAFPQSALQAGADAVVQSTHKTLLALTMGAMLHIQGERINQDAIADALRMIQSSSPSYPIMASLDITRAMIDGYGSDMFERGLAASMAFQQWVSEQGSIGLIRKTTYGTQLDPLRVLIYDRTGSLTGFELQRRLETFGIYAEMADSRYVVLLLGIGASIEEVERLQQALSLIMVEVESNDCANGTRMEYKPVSLQGSLSEPVKFNRIGANRLNPSGTERIPLNDAEGRYAAETVIPYPPGIPLLYEGERISAHAITMITQLVADGARCQGAVDPSMRTIAVSADR
ncbi:aminotransferase class I/II-fold pyridoxal phosphate-dependent enzyme [Paenibacillus sacheonensis]|uniref:Aminotransferase class I/II-fold pyridoxal phosphate-dependent enzyme n=1 Tax=Paenibacillus sacheonensis TaxID=742054 RepID=A0A7X5C229_9BACL|nr:aminotransferase class I/II-fold pyridoxal phosphate-dependent enzyme [Paenibacillus sacheonensis]MBM7569360.1 arginine/lysine/ornithine decarboxylase [Paenibacillus sacheonensis]NBC73351.1 aminotransferase class I/II-fold pyridoxal phosphate-dependent enzyme [Paenibacillus sacheonensis]